MKKKPYDQLREMKEKHTTRLCIAYAAGPGDIVKTFSYWQKGNDDPHQVSTTYSAMFFDACRSLNARGIAISSCPRKDRIVTDRFHVENLPKNPQENAIAFHKEQVSYVLRVADFAKKQGADFLILSEATGYFFPLLWAIPSRMKLIPTLHCNLKSRFRPLSAAQKLIQFMNAMFFIRKASAIMSVSPSVTEQIEEMTFAMASPVHRFYQLYRRKYFECISPPIHHNKPFNILFVGRMETDKGIFDLLQIAKDLREKGHTNIVINLCGAGSEETGLRMAASAYGIEETFRIHGFCRQDEMLEHINNSHAFIVPTRTTFEEGYNKALVEGLLSGRPVITSIVCAYPHLEELNSGIILVPPDETEGYRQAIERLAYDSTFYAEKQNGTLRGMEPFFDPACSWQAVLERIITNIRKHG